MRCNILSMILIETSYELNWAFRGVTDEGGRLSCPTIGWEDRAAGVLFVVTEPLA